jgi:hypothetical protein
MVIKLRKGKGRPVERRQFYLSDDKGRIHFELWSPETIFPDRPKRKIHNRFLKILQTRNVSVYFDMITEKPYIAFFRGLHPATLELDNQRLRDIHDALHLCYILIYNKRNLCYRSRRYSRKIASIKGKVNHI